MARKFAVVTGASSGIGYELARVFGENGYDLLINSSGERLEKAASDLKILGVEVMSVQSDLSTYEGVEQLWREVEGTGRPVDAIAMNAGIGVGGDFVRETDLDEELKVIQLNVISIVHLSKKVLKQMVARGEGQGSDHILNCGDDAGPARSRLWRNQSLRLIVRQSSAQ